MSINALTLSLVQEDSNGQTLARRQYTVSDTAPNAGEFRQGLLPSTAEVTISFSGVITQVRQVLLHNTHASAKITVKWTPNGGAEATVGILGPGATVGLWEPNTHASEGISSLKLTSDIANATYELFIGG